MERQNFLSAIGKAKIRPCLRLAQFCRFLQCVNPNSEFSKPLANYQTFFLSFRKQPQGKPSPSKARDSHSFEVNGLGEACALGFSFDSLSAVGNRQGGVSRSSFGKVSHRKENQRIGSDEPSA